MKKLPEAEIYKLEMQFMPWGKLISEIVSKIVKEVPYNGKIIDLMCGPGYLLEKIHACRPDTKLTGVDIDKRYIDYARKNSQIDYICGDIRRWKTVEKYECVICTSGVHHLPYEDQSCLFKKTASFLKGGGFSICAESCIGEYSNSNERQLEAARLDLEYLKTIIKNKAPASIIHAMLDILQNDVFEDGEYKIPLSQLTKMAQKLFCKVEVKKTWPTKQSSYGDYYIILKLAKP